METTLELRTLPIRELKPAPYNPRRLLAPTSLAYRKLRAGICAFGLVEPLVWNESTGHVVGGHARLRILQDLGVREVPVSVVQLSEAREKALNVLLNNQEAQGRYDPTKLAKLLTELQATPELELTGFDAQTLATLHFEPALGPLPEPSDPERVEIVLVTNQATYEQLAAELDALIGAYDLVSHIRRGTSSE